MLKISNDDKKNAIWNAIGITFNSFNSLFFLIVVKLINGMDNAGIFTYSFSLVCLFYYISTFYNRTYQVSDYKKNFSFNQYLTTRIITSILSLVLIFIFSLVSSFDEYKIIVIILLMAFRSIEAISDCLYGKMQQEEKLYKTGISLFLKAVIGLLIFIIIDLLTNSLLISIVSLIITNLMIFILYDMKECFKNNSNINEKFKFDTSNIFKLLKLTFPVCLFTVLSLYTINCQKYVMTYSQSNEIQSIFGMIIMPGTIVSLLGNYLLMPFINRFTKYFENNDMKSIIKLTSLICLILLIIGFVIVFVCYFIGIPILNIIYSIDLSEYKMQFIILLVGAVFTALCMILSNVLTVMRENNKQIVIYGITGIITTVLSIFLIRQDGIMGAAVAYLASYVVCFLLFVILIGLRIIKLKKVK